MGLWSRVANWIRPSAADFVSDLQHPTAWLTHWAMGHKTVAGTWVNPESAMALATYYACVRNISEDIAKLPLITYRRLAPRGKERAPTHPLYPVLHDAPNEDMTAMSFRETLTHHALTYGNGYAEIVANGRRDAVELYPIHPSRVCPRRDEQGNLVYDIYGDMQNYAGANQRYGAVRLPQADVLHIKGFGCDGYEGYSVIRLAAESLGLSLAAQSYGAAFFGKGAHIGGILIHPKTLSPEAKEKLRAQWQEAYSGPGNSGKTALLEEDMKWQRIGVPPEEAQFLETRQFQVKEICRWFRMPLHKVNDLGDAHYDNMEAQGIEYVTDTLMPWMTRWESELKRKLFIGRDKEYFAEHLILGLLRGDSQKRAAYFKARFEVGSISQDEIREAENENPLPDDLGSHYYLAANNYAPLETILGQRQPSVTPQHPFVPQLPVRNGHSNGHALAVEDED